MLEEVIFSRSFVKRPDKVLRIGSGTPAHLLAPIDVPQSAGFCSFSDDDFAGRFIIWRSDGSSLILEEHSVNVELADSTLTLNFAPSTIIPGTKMTVHRKTAILLVPTQSGIHRLNLPLNPIENKTDQSLLSMMYEHDQLIASYDFHPFNSTVNATKAHFSVSYVRSTITAAVCLADRQLFRVAYPTLVPGMGRAEETLLQGFGMLDKFLKKSFPLVSDAVTLEGRESLIMCFSADQKLRIFAGTSTSPILCEPLAERLLCDQQKIRSVRLRAVQLSLDDGRPREFVLVYVEHSDSSRFLLLEVVDGGKQLQTRFSCSIKENYISDFACFQNTQTKSIEIWAIVDISTLLDDDDDGNGNDGETTLVGAANSAATVRQPYLLKQCQFPISHLLKAGDQFPNSSSSKFTADHWETVRAASPSALDFLLSCSTLLNPVLTVRNRLFDGGTYPFDIVSRSMQIVCKMPKPNFEQGNWILLNNALNDYLQSSAFQSEYCKEEDFDYDDGSGDEIIAGNVSGFSKHQTPVKKSVSGGRGIAEGGGPPKFWRKLLQTCAQLQEPGLRPIALWFAPSLGMVGAIQETRFTLCLPEDPLLLGTILGPESLAADVFSSMLFKTLQCCSSLSDRQLELLSENLLKLHEISQKFLQAHNDDLWNSQNFQGSIETNFSRSPFCVDLLSSGLLETVSKRLIFASFIQKFFDSLTRITSISKNSVSTELLEFASENDSRIYQIIDDYSLVLATLTSPLISYSGKNLAPRKINIAQAFFKLGEPRSLFIDTSLTGADDYNQAYSSSSFMPNKAKKQPSFAQAIGATTFGTSLALWPHSEGVNLPMFLAKNHFFEALMNYCELNRPYSDGAYPLPLKFFYAIAFSGLKMPDKAWLIFDNAATMGDLVYDGGLTGARGVKAALSILDRLVGVQEESVSKEAATEEGVQSVSPTRLTTTVNGGLSVSESRTDLVDYFHKVMLIFKSHGHTRNAIMACEKAIHLAGDEHPILSKLYTHLFTEHLLAGNYREAIRSVLFNPEKPKQLICLHQLIGHLFTHHQEDIITSTYFSDLAGDVAEMLEARCRIEETVSGDPGRLRSHNVYDVTYAFHVNRCDFQKAANIAYEYARRLKRDVQTRDRLELRCQWLAVAFQTLQMLPGDTARIQLESDEEAAGEDFPLMVEIPLEELGRELLKAETRLALSDAAPTVVPPIEDEEILTAAINHKLYDMAWIFAKEFDMKPYGILEAVTLDAIRADFEALESEQDYEWAVFNQQFLGINGGNKNFKLHWRLVISYMELALAAYPSDSRVLRSIAYTFLRHSVTVPSWLRARYLKMDLGDFLRSLIDFGDLAEAFSVLLCGIEECRWQLKERMVERVQAGRDPRLPPEEIDGILPYTQIDILLYLAGKANDPTLPVERTVNTLKEFFKYQNKFRIAPPPSMGGTSATSFLGTEIQQQQR